MQHTTTDFRTHCILRGFIALVRGEHFKPQIENYTFEMAIAEIESGGYQTMELCWEANKRVERAAYDAWGYTASQQFANGIVRMPNEILSGLASSILRRVYGDISNITHFDVNGNFIRDRTFEIIAPVRTNKLISGFNFYRISDLEKQARRAA